MLAGIFKIPAIILFPSSLFSTLLPSMIYCILKQFLFFFRCPFLHRVAGDVERRYHLRYYKTSPCVHETDSRGYCTKNGAHCAFAHGPVDLRQPVYDIREIQAMEQEEKGENRQIIPEDPRWNGKVCCLFSCVAYILYRIKHLNIDEWMHALHNNKNNNNKNNNSNSNNSNAKIYTECTLQQVKNCSYQCNLLSPFWTILNYSITI